MQASIIKKRKEKNPKEAHKLKEAQKPIMPKSEQK